MISHQAGIWLTERLTSDEWFQQLFLDYWKIKSMPFQLQIAMSLQNKVFW